MKNPLDNSLSWPQACAAVGVSRPTLRRMVREGIIPAPVQIGRRKVFAKEPLYAALARLLGGEAA
ncbi:DNA binding domain-containing protein, excisionase family [Allochromatium warmingii]|uniref:DNA binding domain-containing protein, excisionase family n=1 Tax=Allochromatium warmingii TaxID=61595 RepID=A0A1H3JUK1_ALLWA|nr:helix-turn-helix domain-containing protein [Allochromatium warmingii]SDY42944.1 DNA binding domain-containing protein, excisionase family [Allochromatium warmingii]